MNPFPWSLRIGAGCLVVVAGASLLHVPGTFSSSRGRFIAYLDFFAGLGAIIVAGLLIWTVLAVQTPRRERVRAAGAIAVAGAGGIIAYSHVLGGTWSIPAFTLALDAALVLLCLGPNVRPRTLAVAAMLFALAGGPWLGFLNASQTSVATLTFTAGALIFAASLSAAARPERERPMADARGSAA